MAYPYRCAITVGVTDMSTRKNNKMLIIGDKEIKMNPKKNKKERKTAGTVSESEENYLNH